MKERQVIKNAGFSVAQVVFTAMILFVLYRYVLKTLGVEKLGIWSVVLATTSASRIGEIGLSGSVVKFVAKYTALADIEAVSRVIQTVTISIACLLGVLLLMIYPLLKWGLEHIMPVQAYREGLSLLPFAMFSLWITAIAGVFMSGLEGCQRYGRRSIIMIGSSAFYLFLVMKMVPVYGLKGMAYGQIIQAIGVLTISWTLLRWELKFLPLFPFQWHPALFRKIIGYSLNFQICTIAGMFYEPTTKVLLSKFGGLAMTGFFEMANRMVVQFRTLLVSANQVLVPVIAGLFETSPNRIQKVYEDSYCLFMYLALPYYTAIIVVTPFISEIWLGYYESTFVLFSILLTIGWLFNSLSAPAYFANLGTGKLRWNTLGHISIFILNVISGVLMGLFNGGFGVVVAWVLSLSVGSAIITISYYVENKIPFATLLPKENRKLILTSAIGVTVSMMIYYLIIDILDFPAAGILSFAAFSCIVIFPVWNHPMRHRILKWLN
jgi:O-antigen/teichoic acid export membrane protein